MAPTRKRTQKAQEEAAAPAKKEKIEESKEEKEDVSEEVAESIEEKETASEEVATEEVAAEENHGKPTKVSVEHCKSWQVYKRNAAQITEGIRAEFTDIEVELNPNKPRGKSFEITVTYDDGEDVLVWTGIKKGPPRKLKFPELSDVLKVVKKNIYMNNIF